MKIEESNICDFKSFPQILSNSQTWESPVYDQADLEQSVIPTAFSRHEYWIYNQLFFVHYIPNDAPEWLYKAPVLLHDAQYEPRCLTSEGIIHMVRLGPEGHDLTRQVNMGELELMALKNYYSRIGNGDKFN